MYKLVVYLGAKKALQGHLKVAAFMFNLLRLVTFENMHGGGGGGKKNRKKLPSRFTIIAPFLSLALSNFVHDQPKSTDYKGGQSKLTCLSVFHLTSLHMVLLCLQALKLCLTVFRKKKYFSCLSF